MSDRGQVVFFRSYRQKCQCLIVSEICFCVIIFFFFYIKISGGIPIWRIDTEFDLKLGGTAVPVAVGFPSQLQHARTAPAIFFS